MSDLLQQTICVRPALKELVESYGKLSLKEYGDKLLSRGDHKPQICKDAVDIIAEEIKARFGEEISNKSKQALLNIGSVDTAGHGGILSEDTLIQGYFIGSNGVKSLNESAHITFSCGVVPMNNSTWPRGFFVKGKRFSIFPKSFDRVAFHECPAFTRDLLEKAKKESKDPETKDLLTFIGDIPSVFDFKEFKDQSCLINFHLWNFINKVNTATIVPLPLEHVTAKLIVDNIKKEGLIYRILFDTPFRKSVIESLRGLPGTWDEAKTKGTHFFWARNGDFRYSGLWETEGVLQGAFDVNYNPLEIIEKLESHTIVPGVFLSLLSLVCNGFKCLGGYHQIGYLPEYKKKLCELGAIRCNRTDENVWQCFSPALSYGPIFSMETHSADNSEGSILEYSGSRPKYIDGFMKTGFSAEDVDSLSKITLEQALDLNIVRLQKEVV